MKSVPDKGFFGALGSFDLMAGFADFLGLTGSSFSDPESSILRSSKVWTREERSEIICCLMEGRRLEAWPGRSCFKVEMEDRILSERK